MSAELIGLAVLLLALGTAAVMLVRQGRALAQARADKEAAKEALDAVREVERFVNTRADAADRRERLLADLRALPPGPDRAERMRGVLFGRRPDEDQGPAPPAGGAA